MKDAFAAVDYQQRQLKYSKARKKVKSLVWKNERDLECKIAQEAKTKPNFFGATHDGNGERYSSPTLITALTI